MRGMNQNTERISQFRAEVADMRLRDPSTGRDRLLLRLGAAGMAAGVALAVVAYFLSHGTTNALQQRDAIVQALIGLTLVVAGAALFVKASLATLFALTSASIKGTSPLISSLSRASALVWGACLVRAMAFSTS